jgi:type IV fimbrial biogenesis protein FimT
MHSDLVSQYRPAMSGFTLIELITVLVIAGIVAVIGAPSITDFFASQRVRTATSDITSDIAFARAKAIE